MKSATGQVFHADQFVLATGAWSQLWSDQLGVRLPVRPVQGQMLLFKTPAHWLPTMCMNQVMYLIPRQDGHVVCGSSMADCGYSTDTDTSTQQRILEACLDMVPELAQFPVIKDGRACALARRPGCLISACCQISKISGSTPDIFEMDCAWGQPLHVCYASLCLINPLSPIQSHTRPSDYFRAAK